MDLATVTKRDITLFFRKCDFKGSGAHYRLQRAPFTDCINIQRRSDFLAPDPNSTTPQTIGFTMVTILIANVISSRAKKLDD